MEWPTLNYKYIGILFVVFIVIYYVYSKYYGVEYLSDDDEKPLKRKKLRRKKTGKKSKQKDTKKEIYDEPNIVQEVLQANDMDIGDAAEELYDAIHTDMCNGKLSPEAFREVAGDAWGNHTGLYIELKQLYNQCKESGADPNKSITSAEYTRILDKLA